MNHEAARLLAREASCDGKERFVTRALAERVAGRIARRDRGRIQSYSCRACGGFHVGSTAGGKR